MKLEKAFHLFVELAPKTSFDLFVLKSAQVKYYLYKTE